MRASLKQWQSLRRIFFSLTKYVSLTFYCSFPNLFSLKLSCSIFHTDQWSSGKKKLAPTGCTSFLPPTPCYCSFRFLPNLWCSISCPKHGVTLRVAISHLCQGLDLGLLHSNRHLLHLVNPQYILSLQSINIFLF